MELSFIRCSNCRSLVPASAKTCRMCGATISDEINPRSRTITSLGADKETQAIIKQVRESVKSEVQNPLQDFLEQSQSDGIQEDVDSEDLNDFEDFVEDDLKELDNFDEYDLDLDGQDASDIEDTLSDLEQNEGSDFPRERDGYRESEAVTQEATRKFGESTETSPSFGEKISSSLGTETPVGSRNRPKNVEDFSHSGTLDRSDEYMEQDAQKSSHGVASTASPENMKKLIADQEESFEKNAESTGYLRGWVVMLDGQGQSVELRCGKLLLTSQSLRRQNEIIINDPSVSMPHAMLFIPRMGPIMITDLMSENGTHIQRGSETLSVDSSIELRDRDFIVLGAVRLLLVII
ncbi:MAG: FHA domain-containing protein [Deltaproteobacteria bacterium]|nr:FHA domain-containing protein [Deltaproteobacteria bacterium]